MRAFKLKTDSAGKGTGQFTAHTLYEFPQGQSQGHGLGCGDIAGNGRMDIVLRGGWLEAPANPWSGPWQWHGENALDFAASVPILVVDVPSPANDG